LRRDDSVYLGHILAVDLDAVWHTVKKDIPRLKSEVTIIVDAMM